MNYQPDPGGNFASDVHRRTLGHLPPKEAIEVGDLVERMAPDAETDLDADVAVEVLEDLEADGHASKSKDGWKLTKAGLEALNAPISED